MKNKIITIIDLIVFLINDIFGWFMFILLNDSAYQGNNQLFSISFQTVLIFSLIHIASSILISIFFCIKERTPLKIRIKKDLLIYNVIMTMTPYFLFLSSVYFKKNYTH